VENDPGRSDIPAVLSGLWWGLAGGRDGRVMVSNVSGDLKVADVFLDFGGKQHPSAPLVFNPHETKVLSIAQLLADINVSVSEAPEGGITIIQRGLHPSLIAQGKVTDPVTGFSTTLEFPDPARQHASALHASGIPIGTPTKDSPFRGAGTFTPHVVVRNLLATLQTVTITIEYPKAPGWDSTEGRAAVAANSDRRAAASAGPGGSSVIGTMPPEAPDVSDFTQHLTLAPLSVAPYSTVDFSIGTVMGELPLPLPFASIRVQHGGPPGSLIAQVSSVDEKEDLVVDTRTMNEGDGWAGSGANPWHLDDETESILFLTNESSKPARIGFAVTANNVHYYLTKLRLAPHETRALNLRKLAGLRSAMPGRDPRHPVFQKAELPTGITDGSVKWIRLDNASVTGRVVVIKGSGGIASSYDCCICPCPADYESCDITPPPPSCLGPHAIMQCTCIADYADCNAVNYYEDVTRNASWSSDNTAVASMDGTTVGLVRAHAAGSANISATFTDLTYPYAPSGFCSPHSTYTDTYSCPINVTNSGCPDHLEVVSDTIAYLMCPIGPVVQRNIKYDIDDADNVPLSYNSVDEAFSGVSTNTCYNGVPSPYPTVCTAVGSSFTDELSVHCNQYGGSCGFTIGIQQWHWCDPDYAEVAVGTLTNDIVHNDMVTVLGKTVPPESNELSAGTMIYP